MLRWRRLELMPAGPGNPEITGTSEAALASARARRLVAWALAVVLAIAALVRLVAAWSLPFQSDEPHSLLAAHAAAEHGLPLLPSGVLYLHGATLSWLMTPLVWLGLADLEQLRMLRIVGVVLGVLTIFLTFVLGRLLTNSAWGGLLAAGLMVLDPLSVLWSSRVRMYGLEQTLAVATVLLTALIVQRARAAAPDSRNIPWSWLLGLVVVTWLAVFAHLGAALLIPALGLAVLLLLGRRLFLDRRPLLVTLAALCAAPVALVLLTSVIGKGSSTTGVDDDSLLPQTSFLGDHHLDPRNLIHAPDWKPWSDLMALGPLGQWAILAVAAASVALVAYLAYSLRTGRTLGLDRPTLVITLLAYWLPLLVVAVATVKAHARYLVFLQPLGFIFIAAVAVLLFRVSRQSGSVARLATGALALVAVGLAVLLADQALAVYRLPEQRDLYGPNHASAYAYVDAHRQPGELIISSGPPEAYLMLGRAPELRYLAGEVDSDRMARTLRQADDGRIVDYWAGMEAIQSVQELCSILASEPRAWAVVEEEGADAQELRKAERRGREAKMGPMRTVLEGGMQEELRTSEGISVLRALETNEWSRDALRECATEVVS